MDRENISETPTEPGARTVSVFEAAEAALKLLRAFDEDNNIHGGLISKGTCRLADELRIALMKAGAEV